ncbi:MAG: hypothetical protein AAFV51_14340, partial [Pseudomonadota bacterium]
PQAAARRGFSSAISHPEGTRGRRRNFRRCRDYANRHENVPDCVRLSAATVPQLPWMPETCAYRLVAEGRDLFDWHPLVSGDPDGAAKAGVAVPKRGTRAEDRVSDALEDRITRRRFKAPRRRG